MRILVTGGTGFIGRALVSSLRERGDEALVVSRQREGDVVSWDSVGARMDGIDAVVHLAGEPVVEGRWTPQRLASIRASRVETTRVIVEAIVRSARKPRALVSGSAVGIYGMLGADAQPVDEEGPFGEDALARITKDWERAAEPARAAGVRVVCARTGVVLGPGGGALAKLVAPYRWFVGGPVGRGDQWVSWIHRRDAVRGLLFMLDNEALSGPVNLTAPHPVTMNVLARAIGHAMRRPSLFRVPPLALRLALGDGVASVLLTGQRVASRKLTAAGFVFDLPQIEEALADLLS